MSAWGYSLRWIALSPVGMWSTWHWDARSAIRTRSRAVRRLAVVLRKTLLVALDDLLAVVREFMNPGVSRSGLDRCLRRHGVGNLRDLQAQSPRPQHKAFRAALHWVPDVTMNEDTSRNRQDQGPQNLALLRRMALNVARPEGSEGSTKAKLKRAGWDDAFLMTILKAGRAHMR